jgi:hypothetical protein
MKRTLWLVGLLAAGLAPAQQQDVDGPGKGVARISLLNGDVSIRRGDSGDLIAAALNAPLVADDRVLTTAGSRAELQFDSSNLLRIAPNTEVRLSELEYKRYQVQLATGLVTFRVMRNNDAQVEISTPSIAIRPLERGSYRVTVNPDGTTELVVRSGSVDVYTPRGTQHVKSGKMLIARGSASDPEFQVVNDPNEDDWDRWNKNRDRDFENSTSYRYLPPDIYGANDLDMHGRWIYDAPYGYVWAPNVAVGWAPYRYGRWSWINYWGWTWVSYDPWGWAPYHWGRWYNSPRWGWCWYPSVVGPRPYWRPALVGFIGWDSWGGFRAGIGFGFGNIGWVPLAPYEMYRPWWGWGGHGYGHNYVNNTTIVNNINVTNVYRNARVDNAVTAVNAGNFGRSRIDNGNIVRVSRQQLESAADVRGALPLTPDRGSLRVSDREVRAGDLPRSTRDNFYSPRGSVTSGERATFEDQRQAVDRYARAAFGNEELRAPREFRGTVVGNDTRGSSTTQSRGSAVDARGSTMDSRGSTVQGSTIQNDSRGSVVDSRGSTAQDTRGSNAWRRVDQPANATPDSRSSDPARGSSSFDSGSQGGWRRFGDPGSRGSSAGTDSRAVDSRGSSVDSRGSSIQNDSRGSSMPTDSRGAALPNDSRGSSIQNDSRGGSRSDGGWRRFGEPGTTTTDRGGSASPRDTGGRSFDSGSRGSVDNGNSRSGNPNGTRSNDGSALQRFESSPRSEPRTEPVQRFDSRGSQNYQAPRMDSARPERFSGADPVRISPQIIQERSPRSESPRMSAPAPRMESAPRSSGGGGAAPSHSGGSHSSGGGSHSSGGSSRGGGGRSR